MWLTSSNVIEIVCTAQFEVVLCLVGTDGGRRREVSLKDRQKSAQNVINLLRYWHIVDPAVYLCDHGDYHVPRNLR